MFTRLLVAIVMFFIAMFAAPIVIKACIRKRVLPKRIAPIFSLAFLLMLIGVVETMQFYSFLWHVQWAYAVLLTLAIMMVVWVWFSELRKLWKTIPNLTWSDPG